MSSEGNFDSYEIKDGILHLKYFFADETIARKLRNPDGSWTGIETPLDFNFGSEAINRSDNEAIGLPFSVLPNKELSIFGDWHPWDPKPNATWEDHVAFARKYAPGEIVAMTPHSKIVSGSVDEIMKNNGRFAVIKITNKEANDFYIKNPQYIPKAVSPGFLNENTNLRGINKGRWAHIASVPMGAYGNKATLYGTCIGNEGCVNQLVAGSVLDLSERITYCPVGASIIHTSLVENNTNNPKMSDSSNASQTQQTPIQTPPATQTGAPVNSQGQTNVNKKVLRLKNSKDNVNASNTQVAPTKAEPNQITSDPAQVTNSNQNELDDVKKMVEDMKSQQAQNQRREEIKKLIPKELFIIKNKFDEKGFEAEVEKRLAASWDDATITEFYNGKLELYKAGVNLQSNLNNAGNTPAQTPDLSMGPTAPVGGSSYRTPSGIPDNMVGGSAEVVKYAQTNVRQLLSRFVRPSE